VKTNYYLADKAGWERCKKATEGGMKPGWLHYELADGTIGLAKPGSWKKNGETLPCGHLADSLRRRKLEEDTLESDRTYYDCRECTQQLKGSKS